MELVGFAATLVSLCARDSFVTFVLGPSVTARITSWKSGAAAALLAGTVLKGWVCALTPVRVALASNIPTVVAVVVRNNRAANLFMDGPLGVGESLFEPRQLKMSGKS
jgi:hypothetical protein